MQADYYIHGLAVQSQIPLHAAPLPEGWPPELKVRLTPRRVIAEHHPRGALLLDNERAQRFTLTRLADARIVARFHGVADFTWSADFSECLATIHPDAPTHMAQTLLTSSGLSAFQSLKGSCVLHASAVHLRGETWAFLGPSMAGKTTLARVLCERESAQLVTDDALVVRPSERQSAVWLAFPGSQALRIRDPARRDRRLVFPSTINQPTPLGRLFCLGNESPSSGSDGFLGLCRSERTVGWRPPELAQQHFRWAQRLFDVYPPTMLTSEDLSRVCGAKSSPKGVLESCVHRAQNLPTSDAETK